MPFFPETRNYTVGNALTRRQIFGFSDRGRIRLMQEHKEARQRRL
jgi:hypothetical protein